MEKMDVISYQDERKKSVVESNEFVKNNLFKLNALQTKIMYYLISKINSFDSDFKKYDFSILDFCRVSGINPNNGANYADIRAALKELADKSAWIKEGKNFVLYRILDEVEVKPENNNFSISFHKTMEPYLLNLTEKFTQFELIWALNLRSKYSLRLYEIAVSIHFDTKSQFEKIYYLDELKTLLRAETYKTYQHFKDRVLEPSIADINANTDKKLSFYPVKQGRTVIGIRLTVCNKEAVDSFALYRATQAKLNESGGLLDGQ